MGRFRSYMLIAPLALLVVACPLPTVPQAAPATDNPVALETDGASGQPVLVMSSGARLPIAATEADGATVSAASAGGMVLVADSTSARGLAGRIAMIFGARGDGNPGLWIFSGNQFDPIIDEDTGRATTGLSEAKDRDGTFRAAFGWVYHIVGMSEDGKLLAGYAENKKGFTFHGITVDPGTTVGVYWTVKRQPPRHAFIVSRAHIIGGLDPVKVADASHRVLRWINDAMRHAGAQLKLFLLGYFNSYLVMVDTDGVHVNAAGTLYSVSGTDQDGVAATATIDASGKVTITEVPPPPPPPPATPTGLTVGGATTSSLAVSWDASTSGATSYQVYRDTAADGAFSAVAFDGSATSFTDSGLTPATTYYYEARATGDGGSSAISAAASGTTVSAGLTVRIAADINLIAGMGSMPKNLVAYNGALYFSANDGTDGSQLWRFDGTTATKVASGVSNLNPNYLTVYNGRLYFQGSGPKLYSSDGATITAVSPTVTGAQYLTVMGGLLYMSANDTPPSPLHGLELWSFDGTTATMVRDINPSGTAGSNPAQIVTTGGELYFSANAGGSGRQLWKSDGTFDGTVMAADLSPVELATNSPMTALNSTVFFPVTADGTAYYLYSSDGSSAGIVDSAVQVQNAAGVVYNGVLYVAGSTDGVDFELYRLDGSSLTPVSSLHPLSGSALGTATTFGVFNNVLYFGAAADGASYQLYKYDGTDVTRVQVINNLGSAAPGQFGVFSGRLYFQANDGVAGSELWVLY